ncbi:restriction endonuclease subunit S [Citrobacter portucalensis]|uniref:restriction endonuclease subunit S n=1 Tax=Citrobacter portucalensis TaxID=1639133 RepID=UPI00226BBB5A|nr:restriction endonuclease subunit S [Citrobacter portucalensis]MCX9021716.1 restriction endonuclease subunit S [Citrobacter portucalensis]
MAKYKAYPEYKTTGLGWLTEIPDHWEVKKLKYLGQAIIGLTYSPDDVVDEGEGTLVLRSSNVQNGKLEFLDNVYVRKSIPLHLKVKEGDILICARNGSRALIGKNAKITKDAEGMTFGAFMSIFRSRYNNYLSHVFASALFEYQSSSFLTATINQLTTSNLNSFEIPLPPQTEQDRIVNFLDHETAKIDNLIEKQQQLIELLKEKRQAVISHAVTKGLNPDVPMKDSGVEWLGEVPEHWGVTTLRNLIRNQDVFIQDGNHGELHPVAAEYVDEGIPFLMANNVRGSKVDLVECKRISKSRADKLRIGFAKAGDMLLTHKGTVGEVASIPDYIPEPYWMLTPQVTYYRWNKNKYDSKFCAYLFQSKCIQIQLEIIGSKQSTRSYVGLIAQGELIVVIPPLAEQQAIRKRLDIRTSRLEEMLAFAEKNIELMQERRTALISAAVTGKIDVRDWVAPDMQDVEEPQEAIA